MTYALVRLFGWRATLLHGDSTMFDRWRWLRRRLQGGPARTLDVGSGSGTMAIYASIAGNEVTALSFDEKLNTIARERARLCGVEPRIMNADVAELPGLGLGDFDQALCLEVIEHVKEDQELVANIARLLKPGGRLLLSTPWSEHRPLYGEEVSDVQDGRHVRFGYSEADIERICSGAGLRVERIDYVSGVLSQIHGSLMRRLIRRIGYAPAWVVTLPLRMVQVFDRPVTKLLRRPWLSIAAAAIKEP